MNTETAAYRFSSFFENPFVNRVNRRRCILTVRFARPMCEVEILSFVKTGTATARGRRRPLRYR